MGFFNKVVLLGNVTRNPEVRYIPGSGTAVAKTGLAVNRKYKVNGEPREEVMFIDIVAFGRQAEVLGEYVSKGQPLLVEGRLSLQTWEQDGQKRSKHEVNVENFQLMSNRRDSAGDMDDMYSGNKGGSTGGGYSSSAPDALDEDDIPF